MSSFHCSRDQGGGRSNVQIKENSLQKKASAPRRSREIIDEKREKYRAKNGSLRNTSTDSKEAIFVILKSHISAFIKNKRLNATSKLRLEISQNKFVKKDGVPDRVKSFGEVDSSDNRLRVRRGFVKPNLNKVRKIQNLIESRLSRVETGLAGRENGVRLQKEE